MEKASAIFSKSSAQKAKFFDKNNRWASSMTDDMSSLESSQDNDWISNENHVFRREIGYDEIAILDINDLSVTFGDMDKAFSYSDEHGNPATSISQFLSVSVDGADEASAISVIRRKPVPKRGMDATTTKIYIDNSDTHVPVDNSLSYDDIYVDPNGSDLVPEGVHNQKQQREDNLDDSFEF